MSSDNSNHARIAIILAGGLGKRMGSPIPKVLHSINNKSMLIHILENCIPIVDRVFIVVGKFRRDIEFAIETQMPSADLRRKIRFVNQHYPKGTGHAIQCLKQDPFLAEELAMATDARVLILSGDVPLISRETMMEMFEVGEISTFNPLAQEKDSTSLIGWVPSGTRPGESMLNTKIATTRMDDPTGYGRVLCGESGGVSEGEFLRIVEEKDASDEEKACQLVNCGIYSFHCGSLFDNIMKLGNENSQGEYYLTDMVAILRDNVAGNRVEMVEISREKQYEVMGVNTEEQLSRLKELFRGI